MELLLGDGAAQALNDGPLLDSSRERLCRMSTEQETIDELLDRLRGAGRVTARKMFGEFCVYLDGKPVGLVCDDILYVKPTAAGRALVAGATEASPYPSSNDNAAAKHVKVVVAV